MSLQTSDNRGQWGSKFGFIMAAAGSAVGLGNIWRFPYITGQNGGGAFVLVYIFCVLLIGVPLLFTEMGLGRFTKKGTIGAFKDTGAGPFWMGLGAVLALMVSFFVLSYYGVIAGWTIGYVFKTLSGSTESFADFAANPMYTIPLLGVFILATILIVLGGVSGGIEKAAKILMPILFVLVFLVAIRSLTLDGAMAGVEFYLKPDFSKITANSILAALGQAFFSMSIGWGIMITYGSYLSKESNLVNSGIWVGFMDSGIALLAGFMIFPAVFAFGKSPEAGPTLVFQVLPEIFSSMPGGSIVGALFFVLLTVAALTSSISMLEVPASYFMDERKWSRKKSAIFIGVLVFIVGVPSALSSGGSEYFSNMSLGSLGINAISSKVEQVESYTEVILTKDVKEDKLQKLTEDLQSKKDNGFIEFKNQSNKKSFVFENKASAQSFSDSIGNINRGFFGILDYYFGTFFIVVVALVTCVYVGWKMPIEHIVGELDKGSPEFKAGGFASNTFVFFIRYVCPLVILAVLLNMMGVFGVFAGA